MGDHVDEFVEYGEGDIVPCYREVLDEDAGYDAYRADEVKP